MIKIKKKYYNKKEYIYMIYTSLHKRIYKINVTKKGEFDHHKSNYR